MDDAQKDAYLKRTYSISLEIYERMMEDQDGRCALCRVTRADDESAVRGVSITFTLDLSKDEWKAGKQLVVDHDHMTGRVRGLLCHGCNALIDSYRDGVAFFRRCAEYLESERDWRSEK